MGCEDINSQDVIDEIRSCDSIPHGMRGYKWAVVCVDRLKRNHSIPHGMRGYKCVTGSYFYGIFYSIPHGMRGYKLQSGPRMRGPGLHSIPHGMRGYKYRRGRKDTSEDLIASLMGCEDINDTVLVWKIDRFDSIPHGMRGYK